MFSQKINGCASLIVRLLEPWFDSLLLFKYLVNKSSKYFTLLRCDQMCFKCRHNSAVRFRATVKNSVLLNPSYMFLNWQREHGSDTSVLPASSPDKTVNGMWAVTQSTVLKQRWVTAFKEQTRRTKQLRYEMEDSLLQRRAKIKLTLKALFEVLSPSDFKYPHPLSVSSGREVSYSVQRQKSAVTSLHLSRRWCSAVQYSQSLQNNVALCEVCEISLRNLAVVWEKWKLTVNVFFFL